MDELAYAVKRLFQAAFDLWYRCYINQNAQLQKSCAKNVTAHLLLHKTFITSLHMKTEPAFYEEKHSHEMYIYLVLCSTYILPQRIIIFNTIFVLKQEKQFSILK